MALEHALLVSLAERPSSGYDLARRFDQSISYFWSASHQQIYRTLQRITEAGWATYEVVRQSGKPDKKVYSISDLGRVELAEWIEEPNSGPTVRWDLLVKLRGLEHGSHEAIIKELRAHRETAVRTLAQYDDHRKRDFQPGQLTGAPLYQRLILDGGIHVAKAFLIWCDEALAALDESSQPDQPENLNQPEKTQPENPENKERT